MCLADAVRAGHADRAYLVLGGDGWSLRDYYTSGALKEHVIHADKVNVIRSQSLRARPSGAGTGSAPVSRSPQSASAGKSGSAMIPIMFDRSIPVPTFCQVPLRGSYHSARYVVLSLAPRIWLRGQPFSKYARKMFLSGVRAQ